jgi:molybdopterin-guanine dinucleotide biosynthesis protein B
MEMLKVVGIVGYKDSGKTMLTCALARELKQRGHEVAVVKHSSHPLDLSGKDTAVLGEVVDQVGVVSPQESAVFWKGRLSLENIIPYLKGDIILVEGLKTEKTFPKIVCLRGKPDDHELFDGLTICAIGPKDEVPEDADFPVFARDELGIDPDALSTSTDAADRRRSESTSADARSQSTDARCAIGMALSTDARSQSAVSAASLESVVDLVEKRAFKLPSLDCEGCGRESCYDMARDIVAGTGSVEECISLEPSTEIKVDGQPMSLNPFISGIVRGTILGMLSSLKGFKKGKIEITL